MNDHWKAAQPVKFLDVGHWPEPRDSLVDGQSGRRVVQNQGSGDDGACPGRKPLQTTALRRFPTSSGARPKGKHGPEVQAALRVDSNRCRYAEPAGKDEFCNALLRSSEQTLQHPDDTEKQRGIEFMMLLEVRPAIRKPKRKNTVPRR